MTHAFQTQHSASAVARAARLVCAMTAFAPVLAAWAQSATAPAAPAAAATFGLSKTCPLGSAWVLTPGQLAEVFRDLSP